MPPRQLEPPSGLPEEEKGSSKEEEEANVLLVEGAATGKEEGGAWWRPPSPVGWLRKLARAWCRRYRISQGLGGSIMRVATDYY
uniref:Uncharacterized protein n=1 Tax=Oryza brachyantha TaxID=4533 RepID=J3LX18_ORYBR